jgi:peptidoglycan/xylan/chitin deacetylase (PgdA/CDA1 family)
MLLAVLVVVLAMSLLVQGYTHHLYGTADDGLGRPPGPSGRVPSIVSSGGPVISAAGKPRTAQVRARTIALTFDDGPDPVWTPKILGVLGRNHVRATFFVVGTQVAAHPEILRQIMAAGHQVGVHTFTHADLGRLPPWRQSLELNETQLVVAGATGQTTSLLRPPYSSSNDALDDDQWAALRNADSRGLSDCAHLPRQPGLAAPGIDRIVVNATPRGSGGRVLLMHDGGGDRAQTVAALGRLLPGSGLRASPLRRSPTPSAWRTR